MPELGFDSLFGDVACVVRLLDPRSGAAETGIRRPAKQRRVIRGACDDGIDPRIGRTSTNAHCADQRHEE